MTPQSVPRISLARLPTPLQPLDRISERIGGPRIWIKRDDLTDTVGSGNKLRKLEFVAGQACEEGADILITAGGVQSNHCRATALVASRLGLRCHLVLRGKAPAESDGNLLLDRLLGAEISFLAGSSYQEVEQGLDQAAERYRSEGLRPYVIPIGASDEVGLWGYVACCEELKQDLAENGVSGATIISAAGSGGTLGGLILGNAIHELGCHVSAFNVCDDEAYFVNKVRQDFSRWEARYGRPISTRDLEIHVIDGYVGPGYARATRPVFDTIGELARSEGIILDPVYTGKAFNAMIQELNQGRLRKSQDIVFIHTGGIFGLFPQKGEFSF
ncbi:MAG: D-cysteine desulfhydrase family protein [Proteobacteria bacterium]|nr:D-cysteine desulfhydrase family protein [Pseudomonadota bacterium]MDA1299068.1 D-cysteine desulfhydrase family protein [Pseudomonadota bacterium]